MSPGGVQRLGIGRALNNGEIVNRLAGRCVSDAVASVLRRIDGIGRIATKALDRVCARTQCNEHAQGSSNFRGDRHFPVSQLESIGNARGRKLFKMNHNCVELMRGLFTEESVTRKSPAG